MTTAGCSWWEAEVRAGCEAGWGDKEREVDADEPGLDVDDRVFDKEEDLLCVTGGVTGGVDGESEGDCVVWRTCESGVVGRHDEDLLLCFESLQGGFGKALTNELVSSCSDWKSEKKRK